jgi:hypothetical protein
MQPIYDLKLPPSCEVEIAAALPATDASSAAPLLVHRLFYGYVRLSGAF